MKLKEIVNVLNGNVLSGKELFDTEITAACGCDLMSDVLAFAKDNVLLLTGLINLQVIRTAEMMDIKAIAFVRGKVPGEDIINLAKKKDIMIITTKYPLYVACGRLYNSGLVCN